MMSTHPRTGGLEWFHAEKRHLCFPGVDEGWFFGGFFWVGLISGGCCLEAGGEEARGKNGFFDSRRSDDRNTTIQLAVING